MRTLPQGGVLFTRGENALRKLMWFSVGFAAACAGGAYLKYGVWITLAIICIGALFLSKYRRQFICIFVGCAVGMGWFLGFDRLYLGSARNADGQELHLEITATDYSRRSESGIVCEGKTEIGDKSYIVQFYINENLSLTPGDRVEGDFLLRYTVGGKHNATFHRGNRIFVLCYPKDNVVISPVTTTSEKYFVKNLRHEILSLVDKTLPLDARSFARALLLGDRAEMPFEMEWKLKASGIYHIAAVSGMHVSILFSALYFLCLKKRYLTAIIGFPMLFLFAAVAGFSPSIVRATVMQSLVILALITDREYDPPTALGFAVLLILANNPYAITSVSLQLSAGCMIGILLFTERIHDFLLLNTRLGPAKGRSRKAKLTRWFVASVSATLGAISLTTPLSAIYFGSVCTFGVITNLLTLWVVSTIFIGVVVACILGAVWTPLGIVVGWLIAWPIRYVLLVIDMISKIPLSSVYTSSIYIVLWVIFVGILLMVYLKSKKKHPVVLTICIIAGLIGSFVCSYLEPRLDDYRITVIDVGQGQCVLLQYEDQYYMVDCGGDSDEIAATEAAQLLISQGVFRLDGFIITHYDSDHAGGVEELLDIVPADKLYLPIWDEENRYKDMLEQKYKSKIQWITEDVSLDSANITIFSSDVKEESNESSLCILFQPKNCDILITGDRSVSGEKALLEHANIPDLEILVAGHHGSSSSTSWDLLNATRPEIVLISVGEGNTYGHPAKDTLDRLDLFGCTVYRTDLEGTIILRG